MEISDDADLRFFLNKAVVLANKFNPIYVTLISKEKGEMCVSPLHEPLGCPTHFASAKESNEHLVFHHITSQDDHYTDLSWDFTVNEIEDVDVGDVGVNEIEGVDVGVNGIKDVDIGVNEIRDVVRGLSHEAIKNSNLVDNHNNFHQR